MSLDWTIATVDDWKQLADDDWEAAVTQTLVFISIPVGICRITDANWREFWRRVSVIEEVEGGALVSKWEVDGDGENQRVPYFIRPEDVRRRIGLSTNVSKISKSAFNKEWSA